MDKYDYIDAIICKLQLTEGINFQECCDDILKLYHKCKGFTFEMPYHYGGDDKNDGWVKEKAIFYQMYAPVNIKASLSKELQKKFEEDLTGLIKIIKSGKWNGEIKEFIFIVNVKSKNLPKDSNCFYDKLVDNLKKEFLFDFKYQLITAENYFGDILIELDIDMLEQISAKLKVNRSIDFSGNTEKMIYDLINIISNKCSDKLIGKYIDSDYTRISPSKKIKINNLESKKQEIENILFNLDVVENAIRSYNEDTLEQDKFNRVKLHIISKYNEFSKQFEGVELYNKLINDLIKFIDNNNSFVSSIKLLVVYMFDKCDIFEKE